MVLRLVFRIIPWVLLVNPILSQEKIQYDLKGNFKTAYLPKELQEVSGVTVIDSNLLACVQDENAIIYFIDKNTFDVKEKYSFGNDGDYEGIAYVKGVLYVLRSDGLLFEIRDYKTQMPKVITYTTNIPANNNEGLCYDKFNNRLLIGCKSKPGKGPEFKNYREIYGFDLENKQIVGTPIFKFNTEQIKKAVVAKGIKLPVKEKKKGTEEILRFTISAIAVHPISKKLYLISSADKLLFVFDKKGDIENIETLDPFIFNKPEGIIFFESGDMVITNEGQDKRPTLLFFKAKN